MSFIVKVIVDQYGPNEMCCTNFISITSIPHFIESRWIAVTQWQEGIYQNNFSFILQVMSLSLTYWRLENATKMTWYCFIWVWNKIFHPKGRMYIENKVLRRILWPTREDIIWDWGKLHSKALYSLYFSLNIIRVMKWRQMWWVGHVVHMGKMRNDYKIFVRDPRGKRLLGRPRQMGG